MRPLSASECISPAIARTRLILFTPFRKGRTWKLCITAYLCRIGTMFFPMPLLYLFFLPAARSAGSFAVTALVGAVLFGTAIFVLIFYLCSRLQFAYLDITINHGEFVAPAWRKYARQALPWTLVKLLAGSLVTAACALPLVAYFRSIAGVLESLHSLRPGQPPPPQLLAGVFAGYGILFLVFGPGFFISSLLCDFIVPSLALEDTGLREAFRRMFVLIRQEPGEFTLYALIKIGLALSAYMGSMIAWEIAFILSTLILGLFFGVIGFLLHLAGLPLVLLIGMAVFLGIVWYLFAAFYTLPLTLGPIFTFLDAYALYFLGGRYPLLGDMLDRSTPAPAYPYTYPPAYFPPQPPPAATLP